MARNVTDAATMLSIIAGKDEGDIKTNVIPFDCVPDYKGFCDASFRVGTCRNSVNKVESYKILESSWGVVDLLRTRATEVVDFEFPDQAIFDDLSPEESWTSWVEISILLLQTTLAS